MIAMGALEKSEIKKQLSIEICHLRKNFEALNIDHQKGVLKTAKGLLRIQKAQKMTAVDVDWHSNKDVL